MYICGYIYICIYIYIYVYTYVYIYTYNIHKSMKAQPYPYHPALLFESPSFHFQRVANFRDLAEGLGAPGVALRPGKLFRTGHFAAALSEAPCHQHFEAEWYCVCTALCGI